MERQLSETSSQLQQMSIWQREGMSRKLSNWSSLRKRVCHWMNLQHCSWEVRQSVWPSPTVRFCSPLPWCFLYLLKLLSAPLVIWTQIKDRLRNRLLPASMFKLMIIAIEGPPLHEVDFDAVLALWKAMKPRWLFIQSEQSFNNNYCNCISNQSFFLFLYKMHLDTLWLQ